MPYKIKAVNLQGIRGFNKAAALTFGEGVTILYGENGTGKSSLLQSIEWAITGEVPFMRGGDFAREDAIVNLFNKSQKALVEISLDDQSDSLTFSRTRKMSARTASGKQPLELKLGGKTFKNEEAETELQRVLAINLQGFSQSKYLHQETIREILHAKPEERSQAIDKLLGTFEIREFVKTIDVERRIKESVSSIQETLESLKRDKIQFLLNLKRSLEKTKANLLSKGYSEQDLTVSAIHGKLKQSKDKVEVLNNKYGAKSSGLVTIQPDVSSLTESQRILLNHLNSIDRARLESVNKIASQKTIMNSNATRYEEVYNQLQEIKQTNAQALSEKIKEIDQEIRTIDASIKDVNQKLATLPNKRSAYETYSTRLADETGKLNAIRLNYGTVDEIDQKIKRSQDEITGIKNDLDKLSGQQNLLTMAIEHLESTKTSECPVCSRSIVNEELTKALKTKVSDDIVASIRKLRESEKTNTANIRTLQEKLEESNRLSKTISELEKALAKAAEQLRILIPNFEEIDLDGKMREWEIEVTDLSEKESELSTEQSRLGGVLSRLSQLNNEVGRLQDELQKATSSSTEGPDLLKRVEETTRVFDEQIAGYSDSSDVDSLRKDLSDLVDALNYLRDEAQIIAAEKDLPTVENQIKGLEERSKQLQGLSNSLQSIKQIAIQYEKEAAVSQLKRLEDDINSYYSQILGHPYFKRIKIDIEKEDPLIFSIRAASTQEDTYIPTRFSTAQLNAVALSIFMSYNSEQAGNLPIMILDDPTQNMDKSHKEAFAKLIATLSKQNQVIIATEDTDTRTLLEKYCPSVMTYEFGDWTKEGADIKAA
ncbi:MAG: AAA family ATPase [Thaumarchaeota archaeon]|nr:AAA family ATPase [Nitrososphaerota archaeon]MCL5317232.1 AAA family ATPase [Nitrososphaerota archaeon]